VENPHVLKAELASGSDIAPSASDRATEQRLCFPQQELFAGSLFGTDGLRAHR
jgi:hypothetical protein